MISPNNWQLWEGTFDPTHSWGDVWGEGVLLGTFRVGKEGGGKPGCKKWFGAGVRVEGKGRDVMNYYQTPSLPLLTFSLPNNHFFHLLLLLEFSHWLQAICPY